MNSLTVYVFELEKRIKKCFQKEKEKELQVSGFSGQFENLGSVVSFRWRSMRK